MQCRTLMWVSGCDGLRFCNSFTYLNILVLVCCVYSFLFWFLVDMGGWNVLTRANCTISSVELNVEILFLVRNGAYFFLDIVTVFCLTIVWIQKWMETETDIHFLIFLFTCKYKKLQYYPCVGIRNSMYARSENLYELAHVIGCTLSEF